MVENACAGIVCPENGSLEVLFDGLSPAKQVTRCG